MSDTLADCVDLLPVRFNRRKFVLQTGERVQTGLRETGMIHQVSNVRILHQCSGQRELESRACSADQVGYVFRPGVASLSSLLPEDSRRVVESDETLPTTLRRQPWYRPRDRPFPLLVGQRYCLDRCFCCSNSHCSYWVHPTDHCCSGQRSGASRTFRVTAAQGANETAPQGEESGSPLEFRLFQLRTCCVEQRFSVFPSRIRLPF